MRGPLVVRANRQRLTLRGVAACCGSALRRWPAHRRCFAGSTSVGESGIARRSSGRGEERGHPVGRWSRAREFASAGLLREGSCPNDGLLLGSAPQLLKGQQSRRHGCSKGYASQELEPKRRYITVPHHFGAYRITCLSNLHSAPLFDLEASCIAQNWAACDLVAENPSIGVVAAPSGLDIFVRESRGATMTLVSP